VTSPERSVTSPDPKKRASQFSELSAGATQARSYDTACIVHVC
jgi:hypothetical protein